MLISCPQPFDAPALIVSNALSLSLITGDHKMDLINLNLDDLLKIFKAAAEQPQQSDPGECRMHEPLGSWSTIVGMT